MRAICDVCEGAPATIFCAADEAALCKACDEKVHKCNKLASRHFRVGLADPSEVPHCDICENSPAFFYCEIDGSSLCLQCDMNVHVGGKRTHERYLLLRQKIEFPRDKPAGFEDGTPQQIRTENHREKNHVMRKTMDEQMRNRIPSAAGEGNADNIGNADSNMIDLNSRPQRAHGQASNLQVRRPDIGSSNGNNGASRLPLGPFTREQEK